MVKRPLKIGSLPSGESVRFPLELASLTMAVMGVRGSGKTVTVSVLVEELIRAGIPVVIIDPTNAWWGLKSSADGKSPGFPVVVLGGPQGDLPINEDAGKTVAKFIVEHPGSYILSIRHLRKGAQRRLVTEFLEELYHLKGEPEYQTPLFVAIDEASQFCPQKVAGDTARMVGAVQDLIRLGRNSGFGVALIDARPASVNKDALSGLELMVVHRITSPQDRAALLDWVKQNDSGDHKDEFLAQLARLKNGHAWFWAPTMDDLFTLVHVRMRETFDSSKTPKIGERPLQPTVVAKVDLDALKGALAETLDEARSNDPKELKKRIAELEAQNAEFCSPDREQVASDEQIAEAQQRGFEDGTEAGYERAREIANSRINDANNEILRLAAALHKVREITEPFGDVMSVEGIAPLSSFGQLGIIPAFQGYLPGDEAAANTFDGADYPVRRLPQKRAEIRKTPVLTVSPRPPRLESDGSTVLPPSAVKLLDAAAELKAAGIDEVDRSMLAAQAGISSTSSTTEKAFGVLVSGGYVDAVRPGVVRITPNGNATAKPVGRAPTLRAYHDNWRRLLSKQPSCVKLMDEMIVFGRDAEVERAVLAAHALISTTSSTTEKAFGTLVSLGLFAAVRKGVVGPGALLYPKGLR